MRFNIERLNTLASLESLHALVRLDTFCTAALTCIGQPLLPSSHPSLLKFSFILIMGVSICTHVHLAYLRQYSYLYFKKTNIRQTLLGMSPTILYGSAVIYKEFWKNP